MSTPVMNQVSAPRQRRKVALLYPAFLWGGAESVALWMLDTLKSEFDLTLLTFSSLDYDALNQMYACKLAGGDFRVVRPYDGTPLPAMLAARYNHFTVRQHLLLRYFKGIKDEYDLAIGAFNEMDFGRPGIQYLNSPMFGPGHERARALLGYPDSAPRRWFHRFFERISGFSTRRMKSNLSVANSAWAARLFESVYQMQVGVLYPPVVLERFDVDWEAREQGFVCIARLVPEKKIERAIDIVERLRLRGFDVHLHVISGNAEPAYRAQILRIRDLHREWLFIHENLSRTELAEMLSMHRYGLHVRENEQFGISVAEILRAGCIPFVPENGGPAEIVGDVPQLKFSTVESASDIICAVLSNPAMAQDLLVRLASRQDAFSMDTFRREFEKLVEKGLSNIEADC